MLLKILFLVIILYYVVKTSRALMRAISNDGSRSRLRNEGGGPGGWQRNGSSGGSSHRDVEDAKYVDL